MFGKGLACAIKYIISNYGDIDPNLLKLGKVESAPTMVLGDSWGSKYKTEKKILDNVISSLKKSTYDFTNLNDWLQPQNEVVKKYGMDIKEIINNPLLDETERTWIREDYKTPPFVINETKYGKVSSIADLQALTKEVNSYLKTIKPIKSLVNDIVGNRLKCVYQHPLNKTRGAKKKGIDILISNIRRTREYLVSFNIGRAAGLSNPFVPVGYPIDNQQYESFKTQLSGWERTYRGKGEPQEGRSHLVANWFQGAIEA